jgi:hypothetical protein
MTNRLAALEDELVAAREENAPTDEDDAPDEDVFGTESMTIRPRRRTRRGVRRARRPLASQASTIAASRPISYRVPGSVPLIAQPSPLGGWAAALAMLVSWREHQSIGIEAALEKLGRRYVDLLHRGAGLPASEKASLLAAAGVAPNPPMRYAPDNWEMLLRQNGPLWVTDDERAGQLFAVRSLIVVGISGSGRDVKLDVINPATGRQTTQRLDAVIERIARRRGSRGARRLQVLHLAQGAPSGAAPTNGAATPPPVTAPPNDLTSAPVAPPAAAPPAPAPGPVAQPVPPVPPSEPASPPAAAQQSVWLGYAAPFAVDLTAFHAYQDSVRWRLTPTGVEVEGSGVERTPGTPSTVTRVWETYSSEINAAATEFSIPSVLIVATICTESSGKADAIRFEPGYKSDEETPGKVSPGLMQTLISTARSALPSEAASIDRNWLLVAANSIRAGTAYIASQQGQTNCDPPMVAAAYNAGGIYHQTGAGNRWKMRQYPIGTGEHCDRFVKWFNDAVAVLDTHATAPSVPYSTLLGAAASVPAAPAAPAAQSIWPPALAFETIDYDVPGTIIHVTQPTGTTCWAASGTTMRSWKTAGPLTIDQMLAALGGPWRGIFDTPRGLDPTELTAYTRALGMTSERPMCYAPQGIENLLRAHGPLWIEADYDNPSNNNVHAVVITGIHGDGTVSGTKVTVHDPLRPAPYTLAFDQFGPRMETPDMVNLGVQVFHF